ncbi:MAG: hypothetical protein NTV85_28565 [Hyphomicrobiales bacterium]|nr:hypothetical protein [Hyphomicrobiales bacterium]
MAQVPETRNAIKQRATELARQAPREAWQEPPAPSAAPASLATDAAPVARMAPDVAPGAPHNDTAVQLDLTGKPELVGRPQGELLPETAGVPVAAIRDAKIQPSETARLIEEQGGARPMPGEAPAALLAEAPTEPLSRPTTVTPKVWRETRAIPESDLRARYAAETAELNRNIAIQASGEMPHRKLGKTGSRFAGIQAVGKNSVVAQLEAVGEARGINLRETPPMSADELLMATDPGNPVALPREAVTPEMAGAPERQAAFNDLVDGINAAARSGASPEEALANLTPQARALAADAPDMFRERLTTAQDRFAKGQPLGVTAQDLMTAVARSGVGAVAGGLIGAHGQDTTEGKTVGAIAGGVLGAVAGAVAPMAVRAAGKTEIGLQARRLLSQASVSAEAGLAARILRANLGARELANERSMAALERARRGIGNNLPATTPTELKDWAAGTGPLPARYTFINGVETGAKQATPELDRLAGVMRQHLDATRDEIRALGKGKLDQFIQDYFPHIWDDPTKAGQAFASDAARRPFEGSKHFLRHRTIPTTLDGLQAGLRPVTDNPIDLTMLKLREMRKYLYAQRVLAEMKDAGLVQYVRANARTPDGFANIDDRIATVYAPPNLQGKYPGGQRAGQTILGRYVAPTDAAAVLNNHLSPGLRGKAIYDAYMTVGNTLNQAQLGLSAFHAGFTAVDVLNSYTALGLKQILEGHPVRGATSIAQGTILAPYGLGKNLVMGNRLLRAIRDPAAGGKELQAMVQSVAEAGGRATMDARYGTDAIKTFLRAVETRRPTKGMVGRAALGAAYGAATGDTPASRAERAAAFAGIGAVLPAALELAARPIMQALVPRQKLGVFYRLVQDELTKLPAGAGKDDVRRVVQRVWDSVDNRLGQMVYDNLFWNRTLKDLSMASVRSVGWNLGTIRELGGGATDIATGTLTSHRATYLMALPVTVGFLGAVTQYLLTGEGPKELKDYFYPRTGKKNQEGNDERLQLPSYLKDIIAYVRHPVRTVQHKLHPELGIVSDMLANQDFYGAEIRSPDDPLVKQVMQAADYVVRQFVPISARNVLYEQQAGQGTARALAPMFGVTPAPKEQTRTPAQNRIMELLAGVGGAGMTLEQATKTGARRDLMARVRAGDLTQAEARQMLQDSIVSRREMGRIVREGQASPWTTRFRRLTVEQAREVMQVATPDERTAWENLMRRKERSARTSQRGRTYVGRLPEASAP